VRSGLGDTQPAALLMTPLIIQMPWWGSRFSHPDDDANSKFAELATAGRGLEIPRSNFGAVLAKHTSELTGSSA
jgi:hypothetical protein